MKTETSIKLTHDCMVCCDEPANKAVILIDGFPTCPQCFDLLSMNLTTESLENLQSL